MYSRSQRHMCSATNCSHFLTCYSVLSTGALHAQAKAQRLPDSTARPLAPHFLPHLVGLFGQLAVAAADGVTVGPVVTVCSVKAGRGRACCDGWVGQRLSVKQRQWGYTSLLFF